MGREDWQVTAHRVTKNQTRLLTAGTHTCTKYWLTHCDRSGVSSAAQLCPTLCDPMDYSTPGFPVHQQFKELSQTHVHQVGDAIQPSYLLSSPSPPAFNLSQHQALFQ